MGNAQALVKIRRIGEQAEGDSPDAVIARAGADLENGNLQKAIVELESFDGHLAEIAGPWLADARARLDADATLQRLQDILLVSLAGGDNNPTAGAGKEGEE